MFSEILKIIPKLEKKDLEVMQRTLQSRFTKIAKGFGKGLKNLFVGGGWIGAAIALIDKLINPLKEVQESIDRTLMSSDDIATNAGQFNTDTGTLFKLIQLAKSTGLQQDNLFMLMNKFATAVALNKNDPNQMESVKNFVGQEDMAKAFFEFIQSLQTLDKSTQLLVQQQVFGERQILKMADFLSTDFEKKWKEVGLDKFSTAQLGSSVENLARLNDLSDALAARRETGDIVAKGSVINEGMIRARDKAERVALERENQRIRSYQDLQAINTTSERVMTLLDEGMQMIGRFINFATPAVEEALKYLRGFSKSSLFRGIFGMGKKGE